MFLAKNITRTWHKENNDGNCDDFNFSQQQVLKKRIVLLICIQALKWK
jgi:hypothetical protein